MENVKKEFEKYVIDALTQTAKKYRVGDGAKLDKELSSKINSKAQSIIKQYEAEFGKSKLEQEFQKIIFKVIPKK